MKLRYNRVLSIAMTVVGVLLLLVNVLSFGIGALLLGLVLTLLGVLWLVNPILVLESGEIEVKNPIGMTLKRYPVAGPADLRVEGSRLVYVPTGKRIASLGFGTDQGDAGQWRQWVQSGGAATA